MMNKTVIFAGSIAIAMTTCGPPPESPDEGGTAAETESVTVTLPAGDVEAGRQAFLDLKCTACHRVPSEPEFPPPVSTNLGPTIDSRLVGRDLSDLATAIISPSHEISPKASAEVHASLEGVLSPMGDYSGVMTVRQLVDLNAYLYMRSMR
jgi:cytochrome c2